MNEGIRRSIRPDPTDFSAVVKKFIDYDTSLIAFTHCKLADVKHLKVLDDQTVIVRTSSPVCIYREAAEMGIDQLEHGFPVNEPCGIFQKPYLFENTSNAKV